MGAKMQFLLISQTLNVIVNLLTDFGGLPLIHKPQIYTLGIDMV